MQILSIPYLFTVASNIPKEENENILLEVLDPTSLAENLLNKESERIPLEVLEYLENVEKENQNHKERLKSLEKPLSYVEKLMDEYDKLKAESEKLKAENLKVMKELEKLKIEKQNLEEARLCKICMEVEISCVFIPCGHQVTCEDCAKTLSTRTFKNAVSGELKTCPVCREQISKHIKTFLS